MPFWGSNRFRENLAEVIPEGTQDRVKQGAYELSLGTEVYLSGDGGKKALSAGDIVFIEPGQTALLLTMEYVRIPGDAIGLISLKSSAKLPGLINVSGFHVDPGYEGKLVFTVFNAGTMRQCFTCGDPLFLLWIAAMEQCDDPYRGNRQKKVSLPTGVIERLGARGTSPNVLDARLTKLEQSRSHLVAAWIAIAISMLILVLQGFPFDRFGEKLGEMFFHEKTANSVADTPS